MYCTKQITPSLTWVGASDRRLAMFEGIYSVPAGVAYNSYLLTDDVNVLFDTVDSAVSEQFFSNVAHTLGDRKLDYVVVQHMEPDHSATLAELIRRYPEVVIVCNAKTEAMLAQFFDFTVENKTYVVREGDFLNTGNHMLNFVMAPMVHWPEVMVTYDATDKVLFSADAFGTFGALNGAIFADEVDFAHEYMDEARRYYCNIVGKYGTQVQSLLKKASALDIAVICPLHGFVWRRNIGDFLEKYQKWSSYTPEENGVVIAYASVYGNTENAAEIISSNLRDLGIKTVMYDVSVTGSDEIVAAAFRYSHLLFASCTYNAGIFIRMDELLRDIAAHNLQNRTLAFMQNGSWAPTSGALMRSILEPCKNMTFIEESVTVRSSLKAGQEDELLALSRAIADSMPKAETVPQSENKAIDASAMFKLSYGLYLITAKDGAKDNGCIINTASQVTSSPNRISVTVNKQNFTHDMIKKTGEFNICVLTEEAPFKVFSHFGFSSGRDTDKFAECKETFRAENGIVYLPKYTNAYISGKVVQTVDCGTHTVFIAEVTEARVLSSVPSVTYQYYFDHIKPKPEEKTEGKKGFVCKICGYVYEGETLPDDFICPLCKHGAEDFEPLK